MRTKKPKKYKKLIPDEIFEHGPFRMARYGATTIINSNWPGDSHARMIKKAAEIYPEMVKRIDGLVQSIADLVRSIRPESLLRRAWWEFTGMSLNIETESNVDFSDLVSSRMIDYIQSIIASVPPAAMQRLEPTEEEWSRLRKMVDQLFRTLSSEYHISRTAKSINEDNEYSAQFDEFYVSAQMYWCNVRGNRYQAHIVPYLHDTISPHTDVLYELFSVNADELIVGFEKILHSLTFGIRNLVADLDSFRNDTLNCIERLIEKEDVGEGQDESDLMKRVIEENGWQDRSERLAESLHGLRLFDVAEISGLPNKLISELTWKPGEDSEFFAGDDFKGWPLKIWPIAKRPFIELDGRSCCFDIHSLFDNVYRVLQRTCTRLNNKYAKNWNLAQKEQSEKLPIQYLKKILPGATVFSSIYYKWYPNAKENNKQWCESDCVIAYGDHLFILEIRAGSFTYTSPADDFPAFISSLKNLILKPVTQGRRFLDYLENEECVAIFNESYAEIGKLRRDDYRKITICAVTLDPFTELAAQVQHLHKIDVNIGKLPVWAFSVDDLRIYADVFDNPLIFLHYVEQRMRSFESDAVQLDDEMDHLGLYIAHNNYTMHIEDMCTKIGGKALLKGYRDEIDKFYAEQLLNKKIPCIIKQKIPERIYEIIDFLSKTLKPNRAELSSYFLDLDSETRSQIALHIEQDLEIQQITSTPKPVSSYGDACFTIFCYRELCVYRDAKQALRHAQAVHIVSNSNKRILIELIYSNDCKIKDAYWQWVTLEGLSALEYAQIENLSQTFRSKRLESAIAQKGKIGRNEPCPCGSGKKYKHCCLK